MIKEKYSEAYAHLLEKCKELSVACEIDPSLFSPVSMVFEETLKEVLDNEFSRLSKIRNERAADHTKLYDLGIFESCNFRKENSDWNAVRVPGGWIMVSSKTYNTPVFVPYNE